jgi:small-conductance mechanosensitive channel
MIDTATRLTSLRWLALSAMLFAHAVSGAEAPPPAAHATAPVMVDGVTLFRVRGALALPADERARSIGARITDFAADEALNIRDLRIEEAPDRVLVKIGDRLLVTVVDADAGLEGVTRQQVAELLLTKIRRAVERYREDRLPPALARAGLWTLGASMLLVLLVWGIRRLAARLIAVTERSYQVRIGKLQAETRAIVHAERLKAALQGAERFVATALQVVLVIVFLEFVLTLWPWTRAFSRQVLDLVLDPLRTMGTTVLRAIPGLVFIAILVVLMRMLLKIVRLFFAAIAESRVRLANFDSDWAWPTFRIVKLAIIAFTVVVAYPYIPGSESEAFKGMSVFLGVLFSLGSTSLVANMVAGYTMVYRRAFKVGDRVRIGEHIGDVTAMRLQATSLRSLKNEEIVIPNAVVLNSSTVNFSTLESRGGLILHTTVGIGYETPWRQVEAMLIEAAGRTDGLLLEPPPFVLQKNLGDFCVIYELNVYCPDAHQSERLYSALHRNVLDVFNEHGVQIMTPAYVGDPAQPKVVPREDWFLPPARPPSGKG